MITPADTNTELIVANTTAYLASAVWKRYLSFPRRRESCFTLKSRSRMLHKTPAFAGGDRILPVTFDFSGQLFPLLEGKGFRSCVSRPIFLFPQLLESLCRYHFCQITPYYLAFMGKTGTDDVKEVFFVKCFIFSCITSPTKKFFADLINQNDGRIDFWYRSKKSFWHCVNVFRFAIGLDRYRKNAFFTISRYNPLR